MLGSDAEKKKLSKVRSQCKIAKDLFNMGWAKECLVKHNLGLSKKKMDVYLKRKEGINAEHGYSSHLKTTLTMLYIALAGFALGCLAMLYWLGGKIEDGWR